MKATEPLPLLPLPIDRARALLRSEGGRRTLIRTIRHARARGVVLLGWHSRVREILGQIRTFHPKLTIALALPQADWGRFGAAAGGRPLLCVVEPPTDKAGVGQLRALVRRAAGEREPTLRYTMHPALPCLLGDWQPDLVIAHAGSTPVERDHSRCTGCAAIARCPGPSPTTPVAPMPRSLSNQFDMVEVATVEVAVGDSAPQAARPTSLPGGDDEAAVVVKVALGKSIRAFAATQGSVPPIEVAEAVRRGQLYLDASTSARLTDFAAETRLLHSAADGVWQVRAGDPFEAEERVLCEVLDGLRGVAVDIGAGPVRYVERLQAAIDAGRLQYIAVEPDAAHIEGVREELRGGCFVRGVGEHLPLADSAVDAAMMLRSFNHLRDPERAIAEAARVVKPGGRLIAVDNVVFGLCRSALQIEQAHAISTAQTPFEHYRNANGDEAAALIGADERWRIERCEPVRAGTANQWLVTALRLP